MGRGCSVQTISPVNSTHTQTPQRGTCQCRCLERSYWTWRVCPSPVAFATRGRSHWVTVDQTCPTECRSEPYGFKIIGRGHKKKKKKEGIFCFLTLMPCGLYIWLAVRPSLYPPVWLITWRRVSTWKCTINNITRSEQTHTQINKARSTRKHKQQNKT